MLHNLERIVNAYNSKWMLVTNNSASEMQFGRKNGYALVYVGEVASIFRYCYGSRLATTACLFDNFGSVALLYTTMFRLP
jgi:UDP-galactopyranose mutase